MKPSGLYYATLKTKGFRAAYTNYMVSSYIRELKSTMLVNSCTCHFCHQPKTHNELYPFLLEIKPYKQTPFDDVVLSCNTCRYKYLKTYIHYEESK